MLMRLAVALALGAFLGVERELVGKEAGVRTEMLISGGASLFTMIALVIPYVATSISGNTVDGVVQASAFGIVGSIIGGIGFLGAGVIIKLHDRPHGLTTAALIWLTAAIGILVGLGATVFAATATLLVAVILFVLRTLRVSERLERESREIR